MMTVAAPEEPTPANQANLTREHLANERTFLAWVRTALGLIGVGFVLTRMGVFLRQISLVGDAVPRHEFRGSHEFLITGVCFLLFGVAVCIASGWSYQRSRLAIEDGEFQPLRHAVTTVTFLVVLGGLAITGLVLWQLSNMRQA